MPKMPKSRRGTGLVDIIVMIFLLATAGVIFSATFPTAVSCSRQAQEYKLATAIAQRKMEQLRGMEYQSITQSGLLMAQVIDESPASSPYSFTSTDDIRGALTPSAGLTNGVGTLEVTNIEPGIRYVVITITWDTVDNDTRSVKLASYITDKRPRKV